jgi:hypothetical protein
LQLAGQQTLPFVRKTTKDVDNENLGNTNTNGPQLWLVKLRASLCIDKYY